MSFQGKAREHRVPPNGPMEREPDRMEGEPDWGLTSVWRRRQGGVVPSPMLSAGAGNHYLG